MSCRYLVTRIPRSEPASPFCAALLIVAVAALPASGAVVSGLVPDWNQPYTYGPPLADGPGPNPGPGADPFDAWSAPTAAASLLGHWDDVRGVPVADGTPAPGTTVPYGGGASWHDYQLDANRPGPGPAPPTVTDLGWYMDTNNSGDTARGNGTEAHVGTHVKDIHAGLQTFLDTVSSGWTTRTRGADFALGTDPAGVPATPHPEAASAFAEIVNEIDNNRTVLITWKHWDIEFTGWVGGCGGCFEPEYPGAYCIFRGDGTSGIWGNDEIWREGSEPLLTLGHTATVVGYRAAASTPPVFVDDQGDPVPTDWVVVHDNVGGTERNVAVPLRDEEYGSVWLANTSVVPEPMTSLLLLGGAILLVPGRSKRSKFN